MLAPLPLTHESSLAQKTEQYVRRTHAKTGHAALPHSLQDFKQRYIILNYGKVVAIVSMVYESIASSLNLVRKFDAIQKSITTQVAADC